MCSRQFFGESAFGIFPQFFNTEEERSYEKQKISCRFTSPHIMLRSLVCAINMLCILGRNTAKNCLANSPLKFQDQHDGDRKQVTLSSRNRMTIMPVESTDRFCPQFWFWFLLTMAAATYFCVRVTCSLLLWWLILIFILPHVRACKFCFELYCE